MCDRDVHWPTTVGLRVVWRQLVNMAYIVIRHLWICFFVPLFIREKAVAGQPVKFFWHTPAAEYFVWVCQ